MRLNKAIYHAGVEKLFRLIDDVILRTYEDVTLRLWNDDGVKTTLDVVSMVIVPHDLVTYLRVRHDVISLRVLHLTHEKKLCRRTEGLASVKRRGKDKASNPSSKTMPEFQHQPTVWVLSKEFQTTR